MKSKKIVSLLLIAFVLGSVGYMVFEELRTTPESERPVDQSVIDDSANDYKLVVYYFHGDFRCVTCKKFESYTQEVLNTYFTDEIQEKQIIWKPVNYDRDENKDFIKKYELVSKSIVLSKVAAGQEKEFINLDQIWDKVRDKQQYIEYIKSNIDDFNKGQKL